MPTIPLVNAPESSGGPANPARLSPVLLNPTKAPTIRANPGMYDAVGAAAARLGDSIAQVGELGFRIKNATDMAYITRSQTQMQAANTGFETWTKTNPDPATWQEELDARVSDTKGDIQQGAKTLSLMAQLHLKTAMVDWETHTRKTVQLQATEQNLQIAQASFTEFINQATINNDMPAIEQKVHEGVSAGIYHPVAGENLIKRARVQVNANVANQLIDADPFEAERQLASKDDSGAHLNFPDMQDAQREMLVFRAHKAAAETRTNTVRTWAQQVRDAQDGNAPMPDEQGIRDEAAKQGISPKTIDRMFAAPKGTDAHEFATAYGAVASYDQSADPTHEKLGELVAQVEGFKGIAHEKLNSLLTKKLDPKSEQNTPAAKEANTAITQAFEQQFLGKWQNRIPDPTDKTGSRMVTVKNQAVWEQAKQRQAQLQTALEGWLTKHPDATPAEATDFVFQQMKPMAQANRSSLFRLPTATPTAPKK